ncbi:alpha/beta hydrolase [Pseudovibrio ascidiaceicola]|uniref:alpha/beta hydrolase n=1 Tax=Pseudovibrio ascidiaceicola TaxID=285279 RepID=UPI000D6929E3|nr:alpha/beta hydrolase [Pseudovibrio ascidiaceicola]
MNKQDITFKSQQNTLAGNLYLPADFDETRHYPAIIYSGPKSQIKELTGAFYGTKLAAKGFVYLAFDHQGFGESEGMIRNYEDPFAKMDNIRDAISFIRTLPYIDHNRLYGLGVCASGGLMGVLGTTEKRLAAIATVSGFMSNVDIFFKKLSRVQAVAILKDANEARQLAYETGEIEIVDSMGLEAIESEKLDKDNVLRGAHEFYMTDRSAASHHPRYSHRQPAMQTDVYALCNAIPYAPYFYTPYLGIIGADADTGYLTQEFYNACSEPKELLKIDGANHLTLYDDDAAVDQAIEKIVEFFAKHPSDQVEPQH